MVNVNLNEIKSNNKNNLQYQGYAALKYCKKQQFLGFNIHHSIDITNQTNPQPLQKGSDSLSDAPLVETYICNGSSEAQLR